MATGELGAVRRAFVSAYHALLYAALSMLVLAWLTPYFAGLSHAVDLLTSFQFQYLVLALVLSIAALPARAWRVAAAAGLLGLLFFFRLPLGQVEAIAPQPGGPSRPLTLLSANVLFSNPDAARLLAWIEEKDPDIIALQEYGVRAAPHYERLLGNEYPHALMLPQDNPSGMAVFSRYPLTRIDLPLLAAESGARKDWLIALAVELPAAGAHIKQRIDLFNVHPHPPVRPGSRQIRNEELALLTACAAEHTVPLIVAGDFNVTPWSPYFLRFRNMTGLRTARDGHMHEPTWPARDFFGASGWIPAPFRMLFRIPIDFVFCSPEIRFVRQQIGPEIGSDHLPLFVELLVP